MWVHRRSGLTADNPEPAGDVDALTAAGWTQVDDVPCPPDTDVVTHDQQIDTTAGELRMTWVERPWTGREQVVRQARAALARNVELRAVLDAFRDDADLIAYASRATTITTINAVAELVATRAALQRVLTRMGGANGLLATADHGLATSTALIRVLADVLPDLTETEVPDVQ